MIQINVEHEIGHQKMKRLLESIQPRAITKVLALRFQSWLDESFDKQGRHDGFSTPQWKALAATTLALRKRGGDKPLLDTGNYMRSWKVVSDNSTYVKMGTEMVPLAEWHEYGTKPYTIRVRRARQLMAKMRSGGWIFFGKEVQHPGLPARPVLPNMRVARQLVERTMEAMLQKVIKGDGLA